MDGDWWQGPVGQWVCEARSVGQARVGGFLADLAEDTPRACTAPHLRLPLADAALALGLPLGVLLEALAALEEAGLLSRTADTEILLHLPRGA